VAENKALNFLNMLYLKGGDLCVNAQLNYYSFNWYSINSSVLQNFLKFKRW